MAGVEGSDKLRPWLPLNQKTQPSAPDNKLLTDNLMAFRNNVRTQMEDIRQQIKGLKEEIEKAYGSYNTNPYHLHAVCVHDGDANSGHYYTYIKDHFNNKWIKFDDIRISEVTEEEVIRNSEGGHEKKTGYWVVYIKESDMQTMKTQNTFRFDPAATSGKPLITQSVSHPYGVNIEDEIIQKVEKANKKVSLDYEDQQANVTVQKITKLYDGRIEGMNNAKREWITTHKQVYQNHDPSDVKYRETKKKSEITTLYMHLLTSGGKEADLAKKMLLRLCYYEALDGKEKIEDLRMDSQLYKKLDSQAKGRGNWP